MSIIKLIEEDEAEPEVAAIYERIKESLEVDFVPNMFKVMAHRPEVLRANWEKNEAVMRSGKLDSLTKEIIAVAVSAVCGCEY